MTSQYRGVSKNGNKWRARITVDGEQVSLGSFDTQVEAAEAYDAAALEAHGENAILNFPDDQEEDTTSEQTNEEPMEDNMAGNLVNAVRAAIADQDTLEGALAAVGKVMYADDVTDALYSLLDDYDADHADDCDDEDEEEDCCDWETGCDPVEQEWY